MSQLRPGKQSPRTPAGPIPPPLQQADVRKDPPPRPHRLVGAPGVGGGGLQVRFQGSSGPTASCSPLAFGERLLGAMGESDWGEDRGMRTRARDKNVKLQRNDTQWVCVWGKGSRVKEKKRTLDTRETVRIVPCPEGSQMDFFFCSSLQGGLFRKTCLAISFWLLDHDHSNL